MHKYRIAIDAGHGFFPNYSDPGAQGPTGLREADINLKVANILESILQKDFDIIMVPDTTDTNVYNANSGLYQRVNTANEHKADIYISIHCNSAGTTAARGTETFAYQPNSEGSKLATLIQDSMLSKVPLTNRGVKFASFYVLRKTNMPAALVELAFINNPKEEEMLANAMNQRLWAEGIANAVYQYFGVEKNMNKKIFNDVDPNHWAASAIEDLFNRGVISGDGQGNFLPTRAATRQDIAVVTSKAIDYIITKLAEQGIKIEE